MGRRFRQSEVDALDDALDGPPNEGENFSPLNSVSSVSNAVTNIAKKRAKAGSRHTIGPDGIALIKRFEGCARLRRDGLVEAYPDPGTGGEPWTIGWGATGAGLKQGERIGPRTVWTQDQCNARLANDLERYAADVARAIGDTPTTQSQFDAMVSFHYNTGAIARATLTRKHKAQDYEGAAAEFKRWNKAGGRVLKGLVNRRREEAMLYARDA
ncbi:lysozyme [Erythrobacter sp. SCSIO 43205]|nr:lysozyme [Erythrobacter sp. SCSIO 43205]